MAAKDKRCDVQAFYDRRKNLELFQFANVGVDVSF